MHSVNNPLVVTDVRTNLRSMMMPSPEKHIPNPARLSKRLPPHKLLRFDSIADCDIRAVEASKINEIRDVIWMPNSLVKSERDALLIKAIDLFESLEPSDGVEAMLALQMVGTHNAIVQCFRRAMLADQTLEAQKVNLSQAERLMGLYTRQMDALAKHRGKGHPNITVGRVNVESGGQAIVGRVDAGQRKPAPVDTSPALEKPDAALSPPAIKVTPRIKVDR